MRELVLSSRCGPNMKHFQISEYSQEMTSMTEKKSQENDPEVQSHLLWTSVNWGNTEETKALQRNGLPLGCMKLKQNEA